MSPTFENVKTAVAIGETPMKKMRSSNMEMLRIIAMLLIVVHHYVVHGVEMRISMPFEFSDRLWHYNALSIGGGVGVNLFVLITGYFMVDSKLTFSKLSRIVFTVLFFSMLITGVYDCFVEDISVKLFILYGTGLFGCGYWFVVAYLSLLLVSPFINTLLNAISQYRHLVIIGTLILLCYILRTLPGMSLPVGSMDEFICLYLIAAYIRRYGVQVSTRRLMLLLCTSVFIIVSCIYLSTYVALILGSKTLYSVLCNFIAWKQSVLVLALSVLCFVLFTRLPAFHSRFINAAGACTFGVYLLHDHALMRDFIWQDCLDTYNAPQMEHPIVHFFLGVSIVYVSASIIDFLLRCFVITPVYKRLESFILLPVYRRSKLWIQSKLHF